MIPITLPFLPPKEDYDILLHGIWKRQWLTNMGPLASDLEKLDEEPLANIYNLQTVLQQLGAQMDVAEDVLFLFLTSHGLRDATIDVSLHPFELAPLSASQLRTYLGEALFKDAMPQEEDLLAALESAPARSTRCSNECLTEANWPSSISA